MFNGGLRTMEGLGCLSSSQTPLGEDSRFMWLRPVPVKEWDSIHDLYIVNGLFFLANSSDWQWYSACFPSW